MHWTPLFLAHLPTRPDQLPDEAELEELLAKVIREGHAAWPEVDIEPEAFLRHLAERIPREVPLREALETLHTGDIYLACGCLLQNARAMAVFDSTFIARVSAGAGRGEERADGEIAQGLRMRMLLGADGQAPKISSYAGRGPLSAWVRVSAARLAVDIFRNEQEPAVDPAWPVRGVALDPELVYVKDRYGEEFGKALESAFSKLTTRIRTILQLYFLEGVGAAQIAQSYGTSTRTVQRWIVSAQNEIVDEVRAVMRQRYQLSNSQLDSLFGAVETEMVAALRRVFAPKKS
jgi:RNA polymerase sigma-70 factor (ECF subfamily)